MRSSIFTVLITSLFFSVAAHARPIDNGFVDVDIIDERGRSFSTFPAIDDASRDVTRAYLQAIPGRSYAIRVSNLTGARVGLVIAVDGRNIISGEKSRLTRRERMYVLGPWESATYDGWRTASDTVNEFYFTSDLDSYAGAFGDYSAMGVVAVAVFRDREAPVRRHQKSAPQSYDEGGRRDAPAARKGTLESHRQAPGTGFGDERYSPSYQVRFKAERRPAARTFIKYEWRETLCEMGIARCYSRKNRFWPGYEVRHRDRGFAPYPPGYRQPSRREAWR